MEIATDGYELKVGDIITCSYGWQRHVTRVTKKYAIVKWNDVAEGKFPRIYDEYRFASLPRAKWPMARYKVIIFKPKNISRG